MQARKQGDTELILANVITEHKILHYFYVNTSVFFNFISPAFCIDFPRDTLTFKIRLVLTGK